MRIKHTSEESFRVYNLGVRHWVYWKTYSSKSAALSFIKKAKLKFPDLCWKIVWFPYNFCSEEECVTVYSEEV